MIPQDIEKYGWKYYTNEIVKINPNRYTFYYTGKDARKELLQIDFYTDTKKLMVYLPTKAHSFVIGDVEHILFDGYVKTRQQFECLMEMLEINY